LCLVEVIERCDSSAH